MKYKIFLAAAGLVSLMAFPAVAEATPGQCMYSPWGGFCDSYGWQDGSFNHCESAMGFSNCYQSCIDPASGRPFPTDMDPNTPCP
jgi:hypothetical protein